jgi:hypothetical protein
MIRVSVLSGAHRRRVALSGDRAAIISPPFGIRTEPGASSGRVQMAGAKLQL